MAVLHRTLHRTFRHDSAQGPLQVNLRRPRFSKGVDVSAAAGDLFLSSLQEEQHVELHCAGVFLRVVDGILVGRQNLVSYDHGILAGHGEALGGGGHLLVDHPYEGLPLLLGLPDPIGGLGDLGLVLIEDRQLEAQGWTHELAPLGLALERRPRLDIGEDAGLLQGHGPLGDGNLQLRQLDVGPLGQSMSHQGFGIWDRTPYVVRQRTGQGVPGLLRGEPQHAAEAGAGHPQLPLDPHQGRLLVEDGRTGESDVEVTRVAMLLPLGNPVAQIFQGFENPRRLVPSGGQGKNVVVEPLGLGHRVQNFVRHPECRGLQAGLGESLAKGNLPEVCEVDEPPCLDIGPAALGRETDQPVDSWVGEEAGLDEVGLRHAQLLEGRLQGAVIQNCDLHRLLAGEPIGQHGIDLGMRGLAVFLRLLPPRLGTGPLLHEGLDPPPLLVRLDACAAREQQDDSYS